MGLQRLSRPRLEIKGRIADRECPGLPGPARQFHGNSAVSVAPTRRTGADDPVDDPGRPTWLFGPQCTMVATAPPITSRPISRKITARTNAWSRSAAGARSCNAMCRSAAGSPELAAARMSAASASAARCRVSRQVHAVHGRAAGRPHLVDSSSSPTATLIRNLRKITNRTLNKEPKWRNNGPE